MSDEGRPLWVNVTLIGAALFTFCVLVALGNWQMKRLDWKLDLIEAVEARAFAKAVPAPVEAMEYQRVSVEGAFQHDQSLRIKALTELGAGHWIMTPLRSEQFTLWVNRGFVPTGLAAAEITAPEGVVEISGLVRLTQPNGTFLEKNDAEAGRWYSPDVAAMSDWAGLETLGYYLDADHAGAPTDWPRGGMTRLAFRNNHLSYALTWYAMAALLFAGMAYVVWDRRRGVEA